MHLHRAEAGSAPIDIAPGAPTRLRLRPAHDGERTSCPTTASPAEETAPAGADSEASSGIRGDALTQARAERDVAIEEAEFLQEQLRSSQSYHSHLLETAREECASIASELSLLDGELRARAGQSESPPAR